MTDVLLSLLEEHMSDENPIECVGLVLEDGGTVRLRNQAGSEHRFFVNPSQFTDRIDQFTSPVAILYHSHPTRPSTPSGEDERMMRYLVTVWPDVYHVILSPSGHAAYHVVDGKIAKRSLPWE